MSSSGRNALHDPVQSILFHETTILSRLDELARDITKDYEGKDLTVITILHGGMIFMADLLRRIHLPLEITSLTVSSYKGGTESSGTVTFDQASLPDVEGRHVLLLDDILDTGRTLHAISNTLESKCNPASQEACVLLRKEKKLAEEAHAKYVGFDIKDEFVIGYGLDYQGRYRNLPFIGTLDPKFI